MPKRKYTPKRRTRRKRVKRRVRSRLRKLSRRRRPRIVRFNQLVREKIVTPLVYCDTKTIAPGQTVAAEIFRLNSIFDPQWSLGGHQPMFTDNWALLYSYYRVIGFKYDIKFTPALNTNDEADLKGVHTGANDGYPYYITNRIQRDRHIYFIEANHEDSWSFTEADDLNAIRELGKTFGNFCKWTMRTGYARLKGYVPIKRVFVDQTNFLSNTALFTQNPTNELLFRVGAMSCEAGDTNAVRMDIRLTYLCEMSSPKDIDEN